MSTRLAWALTFPALLVAAGCTPRPAEIPTVEPRPQGVDVGPAEVAAPKPAPDYARAERFLPWNIRNFTRNTRVDVNWIGSDRFWYRRQIQNGVEFNIVDVATGKRRPAFDHGRLGQVLASTTGKSYPSSDLPLRRLKFDENKINFRLDDKSWTCNLGDYSCGEKKSDSADTHPSGATVSPDGKWSVYVKGDHNLYLHEQGKTKDRQLTQDAKEKYTYATWLPSVHLMIRQQTQDPQQSPEIDWAPDSSRFVTYSLDWRKAQEFSLVQGVPPNGEIRPKTYTYAYSLPGDTDLATQSPIVFDTKRKRVDAETTPIPMRYPDDGVYFRWSKNSEKVRYVEYGRGNDEAWLREFDAKTGKTRTVLTEKMDTRVDPRITSRNLHYVNDDKEFIWASERDGFAHLYLFDAETGVLKRQLTKGDFAVHYVTRVDEKNGYLYFIAGGKESERDPYLRHLYRVSLAGGSPELLTPENADHAVRFSPDGQFFVDNFSRADAIPQTALRRADGSLVSVFEQADISMLQATGWNAPEPFKAKARDGETDIYGVIYRPSNFKPCHKYPIIENIYSGPADYNVPKTFRGAYQNMAQSIAELGFVVVIIDGIGTGRRSKEFTHFSRKNLGDSGFPDRIAAMKQLAERYDYIDINRVGVFGFSAGGYNSARAVLAHGDFYKVAVSASGNHDHRLDKADWNEKWMGFPVGPEYEAQANATIAHQLSGKLLLAYGELDNNVHPANTMRLVDALIKANKDFDLFPMPNRAHYLEEEPYFIRRRWDFFVEHLLGATPPAKYEVRKAFWK